MWPQIAASTLMGIKAPLLHAQFSKWTIPVKPQHASGQPTHSEIAVS